ncbi:MAG: DUF3575 domain-containing protein [Bacteroidales bacterium]|nr:DUF3575 domain-containing protein [Bacteroidales bacterium]
MRNFKFLICVCALLVARGASAQNCSMSTNLAGYAWYGTMGMEAGLGLAQHWTATAGAIYNPFSFRSDSGAIRQSKQRTFSAGARFWPWHIFSGWWLAGKAQYQEYNEGGIKSPMTREGDRVGGGVSAGYTYMLGTHFNIELGVGMWSGFDRYVVYECPECGRRLDKGGKAFLLPNDISLSVSYVF